MIDTPRIGCASIGASFSAPDGIRVTGRGVLNYRREFQAEGVQESCCGGSGSYRLYILRPASTESSCCDSPIIIIIIIFFFFLFLLVVTANLFITATLYSMMRSHSVGTITTATSIISVLDIGIGCISAQLVLRCLCNPSMAFF